MTNHASKRLVPGDRPLCKDIRLLVWQFRNLMKQHGDADVWELLNNLGQLAERRRNGDADSELQIVSRIQSESVEKLASLTRATGLFFDLANLAEDRHRVRVLEQREAQNKESESIAKALHKLRSDFGTDQLQQIINQLEVEPVFTAHPTEAKRRTVRRVLRRIREELYLIDNPSLSPNQRRNCLQRMCNDLVTLWATDPASARKPTVQEELDRTIFAVRRLWEVGPKIIHKLRSSLENPAELEALDRPLRFGNWIGGDRDGNPYVTSVVTQETLTELRRIAIKWHRRACNTVKRRLTASSTRCPLPDSLNKAIIKSRQRWPQLSRKLDRLHPDEWIVQWLTIIEERLKHSIPLPIEARHPMGYQDTKSFESDVKLITDALNQANLGELAKSDLLHWQDQIRMFGLHLLRLDIRLNSTDLCNVVVQLLETADIDENYEQLNDTQRLELLHRIDPHQFANIPLTDIQDITADFMQVLVMTQQLHREGAAEAMGHFIVSMTHQPSDIISLIWLMQIAAHRIGMDEPAPYQVAPLFETIDDLASSDTLLNNLLDDPIFNAHMKRANNRITCMVGYSDSAKDGGYLSSNWSLYNAQRKLAESAKRADAKLTIFHGRGGALGRGGGPAARAITSLPHDAVNGRLRITEQGEVIAERYDDPAIATRHLEQLVWATLKQSAPVKDNKLNENTSLASQLADHSLKAYRQLTDSEGFDQYLRQCTVLPLIETMAIGSRPSRRTKSAKLEDLRAIPFTFAWNQVRMPINAFYGLGSAFKAIGEAGQQQAVEMYNNWPWFRAVIDNAELALARCDTAISRRYAERGKDTDKMLAIWQQLRDEFDASLHAVLTIKQEKSIIERVPWLHRTVSIRNPYLDMLNLVQLELLSRLDDNPDKHHREEIESALRLTVKAIAAGLRNTG